jgi:hypothetical protein
VEREVLEPLDHKSLNEDVAAFRGTVPRPKIFASRSLAAETVLKAKLERVRIQETSNNSFSTLETTEGFER